MVRTIDRETAVQGGRETVIVRVTVPAAISAALGKYEGVSRSGSLKNPDPELVQAWVASEGAFVALARR